MVRTIAFLSLLALQLGGVFIPSIIAQQNSDQQEMLKLIQEPFPARAVPQGDTAFFGPDNLYQYMDGAADIFVLYGVRTLMHRELKSANVEITADVFDMGSADTAFGMYAAERSPDYKFIVVGAEGYRNTGILNFVQDRYYVKLAAFGDGADAALDATALSISSRIGANPAFPALLARLPSEQRKAHSEQYIPNDPLGHTFLGPAYVVAYGSDEGESKLYVTLARDAADAQQRLKQLRDHFTKTGSCQDAPEIAADALRAGNSFEGKVLAQTKGRYLLLLLNPASGSEQLLKATAQRIE